MRIAKILFMLALVALVVLVGSPADTTAQEEYICFPTCSETDARFLTLAGARLSTLAGDYISIEFGAASTAEVIEVGIFDGDTSGRWDYGSTPLEFTLSADPAGDGSGSGGQIGQWLSNTSNATSGPGWTASAAQMPDAGWWTVTIETSAAAQAPNGNYFYNLRIRNTNPSQSFISNFKVRTNSVATLKAPQAFAFIGALHVVADAETVYPGYPDSLENSTYDGSWDFYVDVATSTASFGIWDGDMDYGSSDCVQKDTDDPNTPNNVLPGWATNTEVSYEGLAVGVGSCSGGAPGRPTGAPADDTGTALFRRSPSVIYQVMAPDGMVYRNENPSGNKEWEHFLITGDAAATANDADYAPGVAADNQSYVPGEFLPAGIYHINMQGMDLANLNAWRLSYDVIGVCSDGTVCKEILRPYNVGDQLWLDLDGDGQYDPDESPLANVTVNLLDANGQVIDTAVTGTDGTYIFEVTAGDYSVEVAQSNFDLSGPLFGLTSTTGGEQQSASVVAANIMTLDFGYRPAGGQGCTPGYWKQPQHFDSWVGYSPDDSFDAVFGVSSDLGGTLLDHAKKGGGGEKALGRHAVAALLNTANDGVNYLYRTNNVIQLVQQAYASGDFETAKNMLVEQNESGCPLN